MHIESQERGGYLHVIVSGGFTLRGAQQAFLDVLEAVALHRSEKVLFDGRRIHGHVKPMERYFFGDFVGKASTDFYKQAITAHATAFAFVLPTGILDPGRFGETVAANRGMLVMACDNVADALRWLGVAETGATASAHAD